MTDIFLDEDHDLSLSGQDLAFVIMSQKTAWGASPVFIAVVVVSLCTYTGIGR